jgi:hypothetical protein
MGTEKTITFGRFIFLIICASFPFIWLDNWEYNVFVLYSEKLITVCSWILTWSRDCLVKICKTQPFYQVLALHSLRPLERWIWMIGNMKLSNLRWQCMLVGISLNYITSLWEISSQFVWAMESLYSCKSDSQFNNMIGLVKSVSESIQLPRVFCKIWIFSFHVCFLSFVFSKHLVVQNISDENSNDFKWISVTVITLNLMITMINKATEFR